MQSAETHTTCGPATILDNNELIGRVIEKHKNFIEEYSGEYGSLQKIASEGRASYQHINKEQESIETRIVVLKEKRHQLYNQSRKLRIQAFSYIKEQHHDLPEKDIGLLENRLQKSNLSADDEYDCICKLGSLLNESISSEIDEIHKRTISSIINILDTAKAAREELEVMMGSPEKMKHDSINLEKSIEETENRLLWLDRRIGLHKAALEYWEKESKRPGSL